MIRIKICGMRDADNIREIAALEPDYMGFIFYPESKRFVGTDFSFFRIIPGNTKRVGVFVNEKISRILEIAETCRLQMIQLHGSESPAMCGRIQSAGYEVIKSFGVDNEFDFSVMKPYEEVCEYYLLDKKSGQHGGTGQKFNWQMISRYPYTLPFFLSGGIEPADVSIISEIQNPAFFGVDINSRFERAPGIKDALVAKEFIVKLRTQNVKSAT